MSLEAFLFPMENVAFCAGFFPLEHFILLLSEEQMLF